MEKEVRMWVKAVLILSGLLLFCFLAGRHRPEIDEEKEERIRQYEEDESIEKIEMVLLAYDELLGKENRALSADGVLYSYGTEEIKEVLYYQITAYVRDGMILEVVKKAEQTETLLQNVWISETERSRILCWLNGNPFYLPVMVEKEMREQAADISLKAGSICGCRFKIEKISGKLLAVSENEVNIDGQKWQLDEAVKVYRLYGTFAELTLSELPIGYDNTDYVIDQGKICACLVVSEDEMETIRVLLKSGNYSSDHHESVQITADCTYELSYGEKSEIFQSGEEIHILPDSRYFEETDRIIVTALVNSGKIKISNLKRNRESCDYRGKLEILRTDEGLAVVNELLLEEYLYSVVPAEMPVSYPQESLRAQAVCARTYAYGNIRKAGLPEFGAHVDDSTAFQVYGNAEERAETTEAVKETKGKILTYQGEVVSAYYYSTSCGYGTDLSAWNTAETKSLPYLKAQAVIFPKNGETGKKDLNDFQISEAEQMAEEMTEEEAFQKFIMECPENFPESQEAWFRWKYEAEELEAGRLLQRIKERYTAQPAHVLTRCGEDYVSQMPEELGEVTGLRILTRNSGGSAAELLIEGTKGSYLVRTEYNIRYVLNNGKTPVIRMDGSKIDSPTLLPSSFFVMETLEKEGRINGYRLWGGGYGHGIGMSQNGAKNMAEQQMGAEEILQYFYRGSVMETIY